MSRRIAVIDAETDPFRKGRVPVPFLWGFYDGKRYLQFERTDDLCEFLYNENCIAYAHNGGKFDFHYMLGNLEAYDDLTIINGRIALMHIGMCELRDSFLILSVPLAAYQKDKIDYGIFEKGERDKPANRRKISAYLQSDCRYLHQMVSAFHKRFGDNLTQAGAAMKEWGKVSKREELLPADRTDKVFYDELSPYYYGGRVECFESGIIDADFAVYDINSAYPYAMLHFHPYSANYEKVNGYVSGADFYRLRCIAGGCFPYRGLGGDHGHNAGLTFPNDNECREYTVTKCEYAAAIQTKSVRKVVVLESLVFARHETFQAYIRQFWDERKAAQLAKDTLGDIFAKLLMNSLYGKWAANPANYRNYIVVPPGDGVALASEKSAFKFAGELGPWILGASPLDEWSSRYYNVATGASITGFVRAMLWRAIHASKGVLYVDTDSIAARAKGAEIILGDNLGQWKCEGYFDRAGIAGKKLYIFRGAPGQRDAAGKRLYKTASKGVRLTRAELWRVAAGGSVDYRADVPTYSVHKPPGFVDRQIIRTAK